MKKLAFCFAILLIIPFFASAFAEMTITSPSSGENLAKDSTHTVSWSSVNGADKFIVYIEEKNKEYRQEVGSTPASNTSMQWRPENLNLSAGNYRFYIAALDAAKEPNIIGDGHSGFFTISDTTPKIRYVMKAGGEYNRLNPGDSAFIYGTGFNAGYFVQFRDNPNSPDRNYEISDAGSFTVPTLPTGTYGFQISDGIRTSNKIQVTIINPANTLNCGYGGCTTGGAITTGNPPAPAIAPTTQLTPAQEQAMIKELTTVLQSLIQQLIILLQQQSAAVIMSGR